MTDRPRLASPELVALRRQAMANLTTDDASLDDVLAVPCQDVSVARYPAPRRRPDRAYGSARPAPCRHSYPDRTLEDTADGFICSNCGEGVAYW